jgi:hypothetical protein
MKKIKKFKVNLRKREILRNLKVGGEIEQITPQIEESIDAEIKRSGNYLSPSSIFDTFSIDEALEAFSFDFGKDSGTVAVTVAVVTVGARIEKEIEELSEQGKHIGASVLRALGIEGCGASLNFISKVIKDEAADENCVLLPSEEPPKELIGKIVSVLTGEKIGVSSAGEGILTPVFSAVGIIKWQPHRKR